MSKNYRIIFVCTLAVLLGVLSIGIARLLLMAIAFFTNLFYFQRVSLVEVSPAENQMGYWAIAVPVIGGIIVGLMAKLGSAAIRGHGIPEAMENVLLKESKVPKHVTWLKPLSSAISIGSGGPFGAEGPIIATGGALGSLIGQVIHVSHLERKVLLAAGAAAGMTAIFGTPLAALLLSIELLLFEFSAQTFIPVSLAVGVSALIRNTFFTAKPFIEIHTLSHSSFLQIAIFLVFGAIFGVLSILVTKAIYWIEDQFEHLPIHWMYWPALGGVAVGLVGVICPTSLGVGYLNITMMLSASITVKAALFLVVFKFISWSIALGSGTSGGTLAPILTFGSGIGFILATIATKLFPALPIDVPMCALVGMVALFAGCSRATLASFVFALEVTQQEACLVPALITCGVAHLISMSFMKNSIMTEKIIRRGTVVPHSYFPESLVDS